MKEFLTKVLGICLILSVANIWYLTIAGAAIAAIVLNGYLEVREKSYKLQEREIKRLAEELKATIKTLESEQNVLRLKITNLSNPGRKL